MGSAELGEGAFFSSAEHGELTRLTDNTSLGGSNDIDVTAAGTQQPCGYARVDWFINNLKRRSDGPESVCKTLMKAR